MGNAAFWWYPEDWPVGPVKISIGRAFSDRGGPHQRMRQSVTEAFTGGRRIVQWGGRTVLTAKHEWEAKSVTGRALRRELETLINHLRRGGACLYCEDDAFLYAAICVNKPQAGDTTLDLWTPFTNEIQTFAAQTNQELWIRSSAPNVKREPVLCSSGASATSMTVSALRYEYTNEAWVMSQNWGTHVAMRLPADRLNDEFIFHDHENSARLDLPLEEDEDVLDALGNLGILLGSTGGQGDSFENLRS